MPKALAFKAPHQHRRPRQVDASPPGAKSTDHCYLHPNATHTNGECYAQHPELIPAGLAQRSRRGYRGSQANNASRDNVAPIPIPANPFKPRRLTGEEFDFCKLKGICVKCGSSSHIQRDCTATIRQMTDFLGGVREERSGLVRLTIKGKNPHCMRTLRVASQ